MPTIAIISAAIMIWWLATHIAAIGYYQQAVSSTRIPLATGSTWPAPIRFWETRPTRRAALEHAIQADSMTPDVAWEAANLYLVQGENEKALREFRVVIANDPSLAACRHPVLLADQSRCRPSAA